MPTLRLMDATDSGPAGIIWPCHHCHRAVMWAAAYLGRKLAFDPHPIARRWDTEGIGWIPGRFPIDGTPRLVYAPLPMHPADKRRRASHVLQLHTCPKTAAA